MVKDFAARSEIRQVLRSVIKHIVPVITDYDELTFERMLLRISFGRDGDDSVGQSQSSFRIRQESQGGQQV